MVLKQITTKIVNGDDNEWVESFVNVCLSEILYVNKYYVVLEAKQMGHTINKQTLLFSSFAPPSNTIYICPKSHIGPKMLCPDLDLAYKNNSMSVQEFFISWGKVIFGR